MKTPLAFFFGLLVGLSPASASSLSEQARAILQGADREAVLPRLTELVKNARPEDFPAIAAELRHIPEGLNRSEPGKLVFAAWAAVDGPAAFDTALRGPQVYHEAYAAMLAWSLRNPEAPIVHIQSIRNEDERAFATRFLAATWLTVDPLHALRKSDALPDAVMRAAAMAHTCRTLILSQNPADRQKAADWVARHTQADYAAMAAGIIASDWVVTDDPAARAWVEKLAPGPVKDQAIYELAGSWAGEFPEKSMAWLDRLPDSEGKRRALAYLAPILEARAAEINRQAAASASEKAGP